MPIFWRYLGKEYLKVFFLSILSFISILLIMRLKQIAIFITLASNVSSIILFILYQIPHILPIAISISSLISSVILFQKLSTLNEVTAFRSCGISLKELLAPLLLIAIAFSMINFFIASELTPRCRYKSKELFYKNTSMNPIVLIQRQKKMSNIKDSYIEITTENKDLMAQDLLIITPNKSNSRLSMLTAKKLILDQDNLVGENVCLISYLDSNNEKYFDNLVIENQKNMSTKADAITQFITSKEWDMNISSMPIKMLIVNSKLNKTDPKQKTYERAEIEIARRFAFGLSTFSFAFIGASFGISISRITSKKNIVLMFIFTLFVLFSFTIGKSLKKHPIFAISAYILPQIFVILFTALKLKKNSRGEE